MKPARNDPCPCGSGKKYKKCCHAREAAAAAPSGAAGLTQAEFGQLAALFNAGRFAELEGAARLLLARHPQAGFVWKVLAAALQRQGRDALVEWQRAVALLPQDVEAQAALAEAGKRAGRLDLALAAYRHALALQPGNADLHVLLGNALAEAGRRNDAVASYRAALAIMPDHAGVVSNLGNVLMEAGRFDEAVALYRRAVELQPDYAEAHSNLGNVLAELGQYRAAADCCRRALQLAPDLADAHNNLGNALKDQGLLADAVASYRRAIQLDAGSALACNNLATALQDLGQLAEAEACYRAALRLRPDYADAYSNLLFMLAYHGLLAPKAFLNEARGWLTACVPEEVRHQAGARTFAREPVAGRRLRVGYLSGDFYTHAVSYFIERIFAHHDKARIELYAYSTTTISDATTARLQGLAEHWVKATGLGDEELAERIRQDNIDVLVDLSGHTARNRLGVFARRAAPVQAHYLGFFASTGLSCMDYWMGDGILTPPATDSHFSEQVWRLPRVWVSYDGKADAPQPGWQPAADGCVRLGSFNNLAKLTPETLALWAKVLHALPEGRLLLKTRALADADNRRRILDTLAAAGIEACRIELQDGSDTPDWPSHMARYDLMDIALDPVGGVGGGTTTCDALWMGVPVVTLEGDRMATRMTASMLDAIGHAEWVAASEEEYVDKVVALARDVEQRKALRPAQRERMAASPLCDAHGLTRVLDAAYHEMFARWQDGAR